PDRNSTRRPPAWRGSAASFAASKVLNALTNRAPGTSSATIALESRPPRSAARKSGSTNAFEGSTTIRPAHEGTSAATAGNAAHGTASTTRSAVAASCTPTAATRGPSDRARPSNAAGPRLPAIQSSKPARATWPAMAFPIAPMPMIPIRSGSVIRTTMPASFGDPQPRWAGTRHARPARSCSVRNGDAAALALCRGRAARWRTDAGATAVESSGAVMASHPSDDDDPQTPGLRRDRCGRYRLERLLATGGMGDVYLGIPDDAPQHHVVVKKVRLDHVGRRDVLKLFQREIELNARLDHPNIVKVLEVDEDADGPFMVLEYLRGHDLAAVLRELEARGRSIPLATAVYIVRQVLHALAYAHGSSHEDGQPLGVVHRDISPSNVFLTEDGAV